MRSRAPALWIAVLTLVGAAAALAGTTATPAKERGRPPTGQALPEPDYLPELARAALHRKMVSHGQDSIELVRAVTLLHYARAEELAKRIASEPRIARPTVGGEDDLSVALPERFFVLQDELTSRAQLVAKEAKAGKSAELAAAFGRMMETCVACHGAYLERRSPK